MKKIFNILAIVLLLVGSSCDDKLDIKPLGKTTLDNVDDLETLLNQIPRLSHGQLYNDFGLILGENYFAWEGVPEKLSNKNSMVYALLTGDSSVDRANLEDTNSRYNSLYSSINYMNVLISKMPEASGDESRKPQLIAEAKILRAWYHFILVNIYAKQYDEKTAAELGGIPYVDNTNVQEQKTKLTLAQTYERILEDCSDEVISQLVKTNVPDPCRFGADFGNGVRARVLFQMKRYSEALVYANKALAINSVVEDRSSLATTWKWTLDEFASNNYYLIYENNSNLGDFYGVVASPEIYSLIEPNDYIANYHYDLGSMAWSNAYPACPDGSMQCTIGDIRFNVYGIRSETMYYLAAECLIRGGNIQNGLAQIDKVRNLRVENAVPLASQSSGLNEKQAMKILQDKKRVEFFNTFDNFADRKRWNSEADYAETITHDFSNIRGKDYGTFTIAPDSPIWVRPFPQNAVNYNSSLTQNY